MSTDPSTIRLFARGMFKNLWTYLVIGATVLTIVLVPRHWYLFLLTALVILTMLSAYRAVTRIRVESNRQFAAENDARQKDISSLKAQVRDRDQEIARLSVRPYDEAHRRSARDKLETHSYIERDLLRFLLQRGETAGALIYQHSQVGDTFCTQALERLTHEGLLLVRTDMSRPTLEQPRFWRTNPLFEAVLQDLLYPRNEAQVTPAFFI